MVPVAPILYLIVLHWSRGVIGMSRDLIERFTRERREKLVH